MSLLSVTSLWKLKQSKTFLLSSHQTHQSICICIHNQSPIHTPLYVWPIPEYPMPAQLLKNFTSNSFYSLFLASSICPSVYINFRNISICLDATILKIPFLNPISLIFLGKTSKADVYFWFLYFAIFHFCLYSF